MRLHEGKHQHRIIYMKQNTVILHDANSGGWEETCPLLEASIYRFIDVDSHRHIIVIRHVGKVIPIPLNIMDGEHQICPEPYNRNNKTFNIRTRGQNPLIMSMCYALASADVIDFTFK